MLNQRGGRTLSIVDLISAGTIDQQMAAYALRAMGKGASLLTGARRSGVGKTTLMAALLNFLPPDVPIVTVDGAAVIADALRRPAQGPSCLLAHEFGAGHWFGYIWGRDVADFLSLLDPPRRIASCLHADTLEELTGIVCSPPLGATRDALGRVDLILFMCLSPAASGYCRRVATFYEADGQGGHRLLFQWDPDSDSFTQRGDPSEPESLGPYVDFIDRLVERGEVDTRRVRREVVRFYQRRGDNA